MIYNKTMNWNILEFIEINLNRLMKISFKYLKNLKKIISKLNILNKLRKVKKFKKKMKYKTIKMKINKI